MKDFWEKQAKDYKFDVKAVNFDPVEEELELQFLDNLVENKGVICDIGCGNGRTLLTLANRKPDSIFYGLDFIDDMIAVANEQKHSTGLQNVNFNVSDATDENMKKLFDFKFDQIISKRLLINIHGIENKIKVVENVHSMLKENGTYIMVECFIEPLNEINRIRKFLNLNEIKVKHFNEYLNYEFLNEIHDLFEIEQKIDFESLYYFTSRIYNAYLSEGEPDYHAPINHLSAELIKNGVNAMTGYSPEIIYILKKK